MSLRVLSVVGVCFASTAAFAQSTETPPLEAETTAPPASAGSSAPLESSGDGAVPPPDPHATQAKSPAGQSAPLPGTAAPASGEHAIPDADATELAPVVVNPDAVKKRVAQAKPRTTSAGALTAPSFEPAQDLSVTPFSALTAEESSAISYTVSEAGVATKFDLPPREIPQTVVVTTQKLIKDFNLTDVKQILQFTPGIYVENERNVGAYQYFSRGYQLQVQVRRRAVGRDRDAVSLNSAMIDRVEVLQGAAGLLTGAGAPCGTINIVRKMPAKTQSGYVEATAGPWDGGRLVADVYPYRRLWLGPRAARRGIQLRRLLHRLRLQQARHVLRRGAGRSHSTRNITAASACLITARFMAIRARLRCHFARVSELGAAHASHALIVASPARYSGWEVWRPSPLDRVAPISYKPKPSPAPAFAGRASGMPPKRPR